MLFSYNSIFFLFPINLLIPLYQCIVKALSLYVQLISLLFQNNCNISFHASKHLQSPPFFFIEFSDACPHRVSSRPVVRVLVLQAACYGGGGGGGGLRRRSDAMRPGNDSANQSTACESNYLPLLNQREKL